MSWIKHYYTEYFDNYELLQGVDTLTIYTNYEFDELRECFWSYELYISEDYDEENSIKEESGNEILCNCQECQDFGEDLFEYYAVFMALNSAKDKFPIFKFCLWLNSERFIKEASENTFERYEELYNCDFLRGLGKDLTKLLSDTALRQYAVLTAEGLPF